MKIIKYLVFSLFITSLSYAQQLGWSVIYRPPDAVTTVIDFVDSLHGWVQSWTGIRRTTDGGIVWSEPFTKLNAVIQSIKFFDRKEGWAVASNNTPTAAIYKSVDSGKTWQELYRNDRIKFYGKAITKYKVIAAGLKDYTYPKTDTAVIVRTIDGGKSFSETAFLDSPLVYFRKLDFVDSLHGWIYGEYDTTGVGSIPFNQTFLWTSDGGNSWKRVNMEGPKPPYEFNSLFFIDSRHGWGWDRSLFKTTNGGKSWKLQWEQPLHEDIEFNKIIFVDSLNGWGYGSGFLHGATREVIYRTTDGGNSWVKESEDKSTICYDAVMLSKTLGYVAADEAILKYGTVTAVKKPKTVPTGYILKDCYPNPFNSTTTIEYELPERTWVELKVFDILGKEIAILVNEEQSAGIYQKAFNAHGELSSGIYQYKIQANGFQQVKQMILLK